jgi:hypothetical protein
LSFSKRLPGSELTADDRFSELLDEQLDERLETLFGAGGTPF